MKTSISRVTILLVLAANIAACVPAVPHLAHLRPAVSGIILEEETPIPDVELFLGKFPGTNHPCTNVGEVVPVSADGSFSWASVEEHKFTDSLINPVEVRGRLTVLCIRHPAKGVLIGSVMFMKESKPLSLRLACNLAHPRSNNIRSGPHTALPMLGQASYCESTPAGSF